MARTKNASTTTDEVAPEAPTEEKLTFSAKNIADELGTDQKSFRRWLRTYTDARANKGGRWIFDADDKAAVIAAYNTRSTAGTKPTAKAKVTDDAGDDTDA